MKALFTIPAVIAGVLLATAVQAENPKDRDRDRDQSQVSGTMLFGSDLIHQKVLAADGREIGHVNDLIIDPASGKIKFGVVSMGGGFMGMGNKDVTIPWDKLHTSATTAGYQVVIDETTLREAPVFTRTAYTAHYASQAPAEQTFRGSVVNVDTSLNRDNAGASFVALKVKTDEGTYAVQCSRDWFNEKDQLKLKNGDQVTIRGYFTGMGAQRQIVAQEISANGKTVQLSTEGLPYRETSGEQPADQNPPSQR